MRLARLLPPALRPAGMKSGGPVVPVVRLQGAIMAAGSPLRPTLSLATVAPLLERAFSTKAPAVAIAINSPGGAPVQARLIYKRIRDLAKEKEREVIVFTEDVAASGGYMIACAGDTIVADPSSIVGSIGVISQSFGFVEAIDKLGIERRVYTAGENKSTLDPFLPTDPNDVEHLKNLQEDVHRIFIDLVREARRDRLGEHPDLFTGRFWSGVQARELGLVDELGDLRSVLRARFGDDVRPRVIAPPRGLFGRRTGGLGVEAGTVQAAAMIEGGLAALAERAQWSRYGL